MSFYNKDENINDIMNVSIKDLHKKFKWCVDDKNPTNKKIYCDFCSGKCGVPCCFNSCCQTFLAMK